MGAVTSCVQGRFRHRARKYEEIKRPEYRERVYALASEIARMYDHPTPPGTILGPSFTMRELPGSNSIFTPTGYQPRGVYTGFGSTGSAPPPHAENGTIQQGSGGVEASPSPRETTNDTSEDSATLVEEASTLSVITNPDPPAYPRRTSGVAEILATLGLPQREHADSVQDGRLETDGADVEQTD